MPEAIVQPVRERVIALRDAGKTTRVVAELMNVSESWVRRVMQVRREQGRLAPLPRGGKRYATIDLEELQKLVDAQPDITLKELQACLKANCSISGIDAALRRLDLTFKKRRSTPKSRNDRTSQSVASRGLKIRSSPPTAG